MKKLVLIGLLLSGITGTTQANQTQIDAVELAAMQLNTQELQSLIMNNASYEQALAYYRLAVTHNLNAKQDKAIESLNLSMKLLEMEVEANPQDGESWALLAQVYGLKIAFEPLKGVVYGPKASEALSNAHDINPQNPRVFLVKGISEYHTPAMFGGSKKGAVKSLTKAIALYPQDKASNYHWGEADAYIWRGLAYIDLGDKPKALADFQSAQLVAPDNGWARDLEQSHQ